MPVKLSITYPPSACHALTCVMSLFSRERYQINRTRTYKRKHRFLSSNYCLLRISPLKKVFERSLYTPRSCNHDKYKELKLLLLNVSTYGLKELLPSFANNIHISHTSGPKRKKKIHGEIIRVCMGILRPLLGIKKIQSNSQ